MFDWRNHPALLSSLLANVLLAGTVSWWLFSRPSAGGAAPPLTTSDLPPEVAQSAATTWDWSRVRSADDAVYARNLRALGVPEHNVVDLVLGEITARYAEQWRKEAGAMPAYWQSVGIGAAKEQARLLSARARLEREWREAIERALGTRALKALAKYQLWNEDAEATHLDFLSQEKQAQLAAIHSRYAVMKTLANPALLNESDMRAAVANEARERAEITALLSPRELEDLDLRRSPAAERLRQELRGFDATEAEFKQLFRIRRDYETTLDANTDVRDPNVLQVRIEAERRFAEEARATLGEQRYADYQRARDPDFQNALQTSQYHSLPADTATRIYELKRAVDAQANGITSNPAFPEQRQRELLGKIQSETESALRNLLGAEVLAEYRRNNRWWRFDE
jgi:hypothetical protein